MKSVQFSFKNELGDVQLNCAFPEDDQTKRKLQDFVVLLTQAADEIKKEVDKRE